MGIIAWIIVDRTWVKSEDEALAKSSYEAAPKVVEEIKPTTSTEKLELNSRVFHETLRAAQLGNKNAKTKVGTLYLYGRGVEQSGAEGERWLLLAADDWQVEAMKLLAISYSAGLYGVSQDRVLAMIFFAITSGFDDKASQTQLNILKAEATPEQLAEALALGEKIASRRSEDHPFSSVINERNEEIKSVGAFLDDIASGKPPPEAQEPVPSAPMAPPVEAAPNSSATNSSGGSILDQISRGMTGDSHTPAGDNPIKTTDLGTAISMGATISTEKALGPVYEWTSVEGKRLEAHFISYTDKGVELKVAATGEIHMIPLTRLSLDSRKQADELNDKVVADVMEHLPTDHRLQTGFKEVYGRTDGLGQIIVKNGFKEDVLIKLVENGKLRVTIYVRAGSETKIWQIPDGEYSLLYCAGYGWKHQKRSFSRGRRAYKLDAPASFSTSYAGQSPEWQSYNLSLSVTGNVDSPTAMSSVSVDEFDKF